MVYTFRLKAGDDLKQGIEAFFKARNLTSASISTCVGSLSKLCIRMAGASPNRQDIQTFNGHYEIVSLVGTLSKDGNHIHISASDKIGDVIGGHLKEGSIINTTAEVVLLESQNETYKRQLDKDTGFSELSVDK